LMAMHHVETARSYIIYRHERAKRRAMRSVSLEISDNIPYRKIYEVLVWNMNHGCDSVAGLNRLIADGDRIAEVWEYLDTLHQQRQGAFAGH